MQRLKEYRLLEKIDYKAGQVSGCVYKLTKADMTELYNTVNYPSKIVNEPDVCHLLGVRSVR